MVVEVPNTVEYGRSFFHQAYGSDVSDTPADLVSKLVNDRSQVAGPFQSLEESLLSVDVQKEFPEAGLLDTIVADILSDSLKSRQNYQRFVVELRKDPDLLLKSVNKGQESIDVVAHHIAAIRQHYLDIHRGETTELLEGLKSLGQRGKNAEGIKLLQEILGDTNGDVEEKDQTANENQMALEMAAQAAVDGDSSSKLSFVDPLFKFEQIKVVFDRIYKGVAGMDRQSQEFSDRVDMIRQQTIWFVTYSGLSEYFQSLLGDAGNAFEAATAVGDMVSGYFKLRKTFESFQHLNKGNSQELSGVAHEMPTSVEVEALLHCFNYDMRIIDVDGNERVISDGIKERMQYFLGGAVAPQKLGMLEYVASAKTDNDVRGSREKVMNTLSFYRQDIEARYGVEFDAGKTYEKWFKLLNSGIKVDLEKIGEGNLYKDWTQEEIRFAKEVLTTEIWNDPDEEHEYKTRAGLVLKGQDILPIFLDDTSGSVLEKYGEMIFFDFGDPKIGVLQQCAEHFVRHLSDINDDSLGEYFNYLMKKNGINTSKIQAVDLPRFANGEEWNVEIVTSKGRRGGVNRMEIGLLSGGGIAEVGAQGDPQAPFAYLYEVVRDRTGKAIRDPDTGELILAPLRDENGNEMLAQRDGKKIERRYKNGKTIIVDGEKLYKPELNKYGNEKYQPVIENGVPQTVTRREFLVKNIMGARMSGVNRAAMSLFQGMLYQDGDVYDEGQVYSKGLLRALNWAAYSWHYSMELPYLDYLYTPTMSDITYRKIDDNLLIAACKSNVDKKVRMRNPARNVQEVQLRSWVEGEKLNDDVALQLKWLLSAPRREIGLQELDDVALSRIVQVAETLQKENKSVEEIKEKLVPIAQEYSREFFNDYASDEDIYGSAGRMRSPREIMAELMGRKELSDVFRGELSISNIAPSLGVDISRYPQFMLEGRLGLSTLMTRYEQLGMHDLGNIRALFEDLMSYAGKHGDVAQEVMPELTKALVNASGLGRRDTYALAFGAKELDVKDLDDLIKKAQDAINSRPSDKERGEQVSGLVKAIEAMNGKWSHLDTTSRARAIASTMGRTAQYIYGRSPSCVYVLERNGKELPMRSVMAQYSDPISGGVQQTEVIHAQTPAIEDEILKKRAEVLKCGKINKFPLVNSGVKGDKKRPISIDLTTKSGKAVDEVLRETGIGRTIKSNGRAKLVSRSGQMVFRVHTDKNGNPIVPYDERYGSPLLIKPFQRAYGSQEPILASDKDGSKWREAQKTWYNWIIREAVDSTSLSVEMQGLIKIYLQFE